MSTDSLLYEGKAKQLFPTDDPQVLRVVYKDSATAFNGEKKAELEGKGILNNQISKLFFDYLTKHGVEHHFIETISDYEQLVKRVSIIPLEVVVRNIAAGSLVKRVGLAEGTQLSRPVVEFYYKNDELGDPLMNQDHIAMLELATSDQVGHMRQIALQVNDILQLYLEEKGLVLVDFKLEFGVDPSGTLLLADEISPDTCRFWDNTTGEKLDKDRFRQDLGNVLEAYKEIYQRLGGASHA
ncbi:phosphoribosylaminoimidazole-succinocarboxamide synthase [Thermoactinomyces sp. DSM 45891]|uniref:phosphoribosylaminoimidazolesuccinocarboxamide synthase n=1 Tax=Thermoactinomyces sp. DSM 45891 TaxID=1761907 RepID=UPI00091B9357|nr:phosphoribosylaminoimidazolesuccinocarboxamide synthase [Thermoactinomyces sp. DSM 45891]SFX67490.1 phosphoribosylaminoimidazole-succinocarboxamide synthase [Thermoactinomyces sp. DSM 45891]